MVVDALEVEPLQRADVTEAVEKGEDVGDVRGFGLEEEGEFGDRGSCGEEVGHGDAAVEANVVQV